MAETTEGEVRPVSPHLQIYRWTGTMAMSIAHRVTGAALFVGMGLLAWWLYAAASGPDAFAAIDGFLRSWIGQVMLALFAWALIHHALGGIRPLVLDAGVGMRRGARTLLAWGTLVASLFLTAVIWALALAIQ